MRHLRLSPGAYRTVTRWALAALVVIIVTGGAVRLTGSGLGCSDWPTCEQDQLIAPLEFHALVEFVNRLFTGVVSLAVIAAVLGSLRRSPRRWDLTMWSWGLVVGVIAQIVLGALLVKSGLDPRFTIGHFLLSMVLVWNAQVLVHRAGLPDDVDEAGGAAPETSAVSETTSNGGPTMSTTRHSRVTVVAAMFVLATGTVVTGSGPHGGDDGAARFDLAIPAVTRVHGITVAVFLVLALALRFRLHRTPQDRTVNASADRLLVAIVAQGAIGYTQYFSGLPPALVGAHLLGAALVWMATLQLHLDLVPSRTSSAHGAAQRRHDDRPAPILSKA